MGAATACYYGLSHTSNICCWRGFKKDFFSFFSRPEMPFLADAKIFSNLISHLQLKIREVEQKTSKFFDERNMVQWHEEN